MDLLDRHLAKDSQDTSKPTIFPSQQNANANIDDQNTLDNVGSIEDYSRDDSISDDSGILAGTYLPQDMTVRLVRAENSNNDTILSILFSICLTVVGVFSGAFISYQTSATKPTLLEKISLVFVSILAAVFLILWIVNKCKMNKKSILVPITKYTKFIRNDK